MADDGLMHYYFFRTFYKNHLQRFICKSVSQPEENVISIEQSVMPRKLLIGDILLESFYMALFKKINK